VRPTPMNLLCGLVQSGSSGRPECPRAAKHRHVRALQQMHRAVGSQAGSVVGYMACSSTECSAVS
jgi:hypothetical protein